MIACSFFNLHFILRENPRIFSAKCNIGKLYGKMNIISRIQDSIQGMIVHFFFVFVFILFFFQRWRRHGSLLYYAHNFKFINHVKPKSSFMMYATTISTVKNLTNFENSRKSFFPCKWFMHTFTYTKVLIRTVAEYFHYIVFHSLFCCCLPFFFLFYFCYCSKAMLSWSTLTVLFEWLRELFYLVCLLMKCLKKML